MSSLKLLEDVMSKLKAKGYRVGNIDTVIVAQRPAARAASCRDAENTWPRRQGIDPDRVNVKVKSGEGTGCGGQGRRDDRPRRLFD
jgi:2C-methyl-D-erythritol 2,4-cyclodiphosphate synthase